MNAGDIIHRVIQKSSRHLTARQYKRPSIQKRMRRMIERAGKRHGITFCSLTLSVALAGGCTSKRYIPPERKDSTLCTAPRNEVLKVDPGVMSLETPRSYKLTKLPDGRIHLGASE